VFNSYWLAHPSIVSRDRARRSISWLLVLIAALLYNLASTDAVACACGCSVFDVGTSAMLPEGPGGFAYLEYDSLNQDHNWSGNSQAPAANNDDKRLRTNFFKAGVQYMLNRSWGAQLEVPYTDRNFRKINDDGFVQSFPHSALGDIRLWGIYTGFSPDLSTGVTFGVKLPTGSWTYPNYDRDTQIGTGSTDALLGAFHRGSLTSDNTWSWFVQGVTDAPLFVRAGYRPGVETDIAAGVYYNSIPVAEIGRLTPVLQLIGSTRTEDRGWNSNRPNTGYQRVFVAPGIEFDLGHFMLYADVEVPAYYHVNGNQLVGSVAFKAFAGFMF